MKSQKIASKALRSYLASLFFFWSMVPFGLIAAEPADVNYDESKVPTYSLPELLPPGLSKEAQRELWGKTRRAEILALFEEHVYGKTPDVPLKVTSQVIEKNNDALGGLAIRKQVRLTVSPQKPNTNPDTHHSISFDVLIYAPKNRAGKAPAFIGLNFSGNQTIHEDQEIKISQKWTRDRTEAQAVKNSNPKMARGAARDRWQLETVIKRGYGLVTAYRDSIDPDNYQHDFSDGVHPLFYQNGQSEPADNEWGSIGAWAWGLSRIRSWLEMEDLIDAKRLAVIGHSRLGKAALWAGAQDRKFAMVISNNSGSGGAALFRRCYGERIHHMLKPVGYWFNKNHAEYALAESKLPVDQHMLLALVAPRPLYVASAEEDRWADPKGEFLSTKHASLIYEAFDLKGLSEVKSREVNEPITGHIGYHIRSGKHDVTLFDWQQYLDFTDKHL